MSESDPAVDSSAVNSALIRLQDLTREEFGRWSAEAGRAELATILLFRWDPDQAANEYPESSTAYESEAHSIVLGLWMNDDRETFGRRLRGNSRLRAEACVADEVLDDLWRLVDNWLPRSIGHWWRNTSMQRLRSLPFHCHLIKYDVEHAITHFDDGTWTSISDVGDSFNGVVLTMASYLMAEQAHLDSLRAMAVESGASRFRVEVDRSATMGLDELMDQVRSALREEPACGYWWTSEDFDFAIIVGYDYHLYVASHVECSHGLEVARAAGLHPRVQDGPSPYLFP
ncbi:hypothetical protein [Nocardioides sp. WS12]|uniref:hypothetical protein n=1 Tax=Nocardioides sp. WS12 TaxID=2486272 RepID=UPI0015FC4CD2|nr:hypothetical protein [Nocardioides sp. WS12]